MKEIAAKRLKVYSNGVLLGETKPGDVNQLGRSPVDIEVNIDSSHDVFEFYLELANGSVDYLGNLELSYLSGLKQYEKELAEKSPKIPPPPPEIIFLTQGNRETDVYLRSIPQAVYKLKQILADIGAPFENMHTILDFGCGSGRLVRGLYLDDPHREIYGADYNEELTAWAKNNLPPAIKFIKNDIDPPLLFEDNKFDLIILVSVFTHLPLECQYKWLSEFKRILKIGGITVVSLQGMAYLNYFKRNVPSAYVSLLRRGYASTGDDLNIASGSNQFFAAHTPDYAFKTLFKDWKILAHLPGGKLRNQLSTINVMGFSGAQDIYVLSK